MAGPQKRGLSDSSSEATDKGNTTGSKGKTAAKEGRFEVEVNPDFKLSLAIKRIIRNRKSDYHEITVLDTEGFGRVLVIDGKPRSSEADGFIYYESLVHPALLMHDNPKKVIIIGGGEGSALREVLRHKTIEQVILYERDKDLVDICELCFQENWKAFSDPRVSIVTIDKCDIRRFKDDKFDVIIGDLPDAFESRGNRELYLNTFYENVIKPMLHEGGIFVTQAGLAGVTRHKTFATVYNTLGQIFRSVLPVTATVPLHADTCGFVMASETLLEVSDDIIEERMNTRIKGELRYHNTESIVSATALNRLMWKVLDHYKRNNIIDDGFKIPAARTQTTNL